MLSELNLKLLDTNIQTVERQNIFCRSTKACNTVSTLVCLEELAYKGNPMRKHQNCGISTVLFMASHFEVPVRVLMEDHAPHHSPQPVEQ